MFFPTLACIAVWWLIVTSVGALPHSGSAAFGSVQVRDIVNTSNPPTPPIPVPTTSTTPSAPSPAPPVSNPPPVPSVPTSSSTAISTSTTVLAVNPPAHSSPGPSSTSMTASPTYSIDPSFPTLPAPASATPIPPASIVPATEPGPTTPVPGISVSAASPPDLGSAPNQAPPVSNTLASTSGASSGPSLVTTPTTTSIFNQMPTAYCEAGTGNWTITNSLATGLIDLFCADLYGEKTFPIQGANFTSAEDPTKIPSSTSKQDGVPPPAPPYTNVERSGIVLLFGFTRFQNYTSGKTMIISGSDEQCAVDKTTQDCQQGLRSAINQCQAKGLGTNGMSQWQTSCGFYTVQSVNCTIPGTAACQDWQAKWAPTSGSSSSSSNNSSGSATEVRPVTTMTWLVTQTFPHTTTWAATLTETMP